MKIQNGSYMRTIQVRNVNTALAILRENVGRSMLNPMEWDYIAPRDNQMTVEHRAPVITEYHNPCERVLFSAARDANPFFHFMESLWILAGRQDVRFLENYNKKMTDFSDDGKVFHAPYGYRLRRHFEMDQLTYAIEMMSKTPATRRAVLTIWDPRADLGAVSRDIPCNDLIFLKLREALNMTVCCRSNDAVLGAYGANAVQFSMLLEFLASALKVPVGIYRQISDSFHIYIQDPVWLRLKDTEEDLFNDPYVKQLVTPYPLMAPGTNWTLWLSQCEAFVSGHLVNDGAFFEHVAHPMAEAWLLYHDKSYQKNERIAKALGAIRQCRALDWRRACTEWLKRRYE